MCPPRQAPKKYNQLARQTTLIHVNTVRLNFEAWADAVEGRALYRFSTEQ